MSKETIELLASITGPFHAFYERMKEDGAEEKMYVLITGSIPLTIIVFMVLGCLITSPGITTLIIAVFIALFMSAIADVIVSMLYPVIFILVKAVLCPIALIHEYLAAFDE